MNKEIHSEIEMFPIIKKMRKSHLRRFNYVQSRMINAPVRKRFNFLFLKKKKKTKTSRGRTKITLEVVKQCILIKEVTNSMILNQC